MSFSFELALFRIFCSSRQSTISIQFSRLALELRQLILAPSYPRDHPAYLEGDAQIPCVMTFIGALLGKGHARLPSRGSSDFSSCPWTFQVSEPQSARSSNIIFE